jgi:hypothetical protein
MDWAAHFFHKLKTALFTIQLIQFSFLTAEPTGIMTGRISQPKQKNEKKRTKEKKPD